MKRILAYVPFLLLALLLLPPAVAAASPGSFESSAPGLRIDNGGYALEKGSRLVAAHNL
ncbi:MAG: hypothetical protein JRD39_02070, partial [Deltaproteobacteria bacterium]|nr:hypothetical protein [Deltaproteobacteria bacterium]